MSPEVHVWSLPPCDAVKVSVDELWKNGKSGLGAIIHNSNGKANATLALVWHLLFMLFTQSR